MRVTGTAQREAWVPQRMPPVEEVPPGPWSVRTWTCWPGWGRLPPGR